MKAFPFKLQTRHFLTVATWIIWDLKFRRARPPILSKRTRSGSSICAVSISRSGSWPKSPSALILVPAFESSLTISPVRSSGISTSSQTKPMRPVTRK